MNAFADAFVARYGRAPQCSWAPGRVNLIGDHVDYCGGRVLPMPIQYGTTVAIADGSAGRTRAASLDRPEALAFDPQDAPALPPGHWGRFIVGACAVAQQSGMRADVDILVSGDVPASGLSSSASLSVALLFALARLRNVRLDGLALARAAQRIEHEFVGVPCGLMDQVVIALGVPGAALLFDCAEGTTRAVPIPPDGPEILVFDTGRRRALAESGYATRHAETARVAATLGIEPQRLARAPLAAVDGIADTSLARRARHVVTEQARVDAAAAAFAARDWRCLGNLFDASHASLRDDFEVSCAELDLAASLLQQDPACFGARMTGGGFGGAVVALVQRGGAAAVAARVAPAYTRASGLEGRAFVATSLGGVHPL